MINIIKIKTHLKELLPLISLFILAFLVLLTSPCSFLRINADVNIDPAVFKTVALYMDRGYMPYKDIFDHKGPLLYFYNWIGLRLSYWRGIWLIEIASMMITFWMLYKLCRLVCQKLSSIITIFIVTSILYLYFEGGNLTEEYALAYIATALYIFSDYLLNDKITNLRLFICGFSFGAVCLLRINMIATWLVFCIAVLVKTIRSKQIHEIKRFLLWFILGLLVIILPFLLWLGINGALSDFFDSYILFNMKYSNDPHRANLTNKTQAFFAFASNPLVLFSTAITAYLVCQKRDIYHYSLFFYTILSLYLTIMSGQTYGHYGMTLIPICIYPVSYCIHLIDSKMDYKKLIGTVISIYLIATIALPHWYGFFQNILITIDQHGCDVEWSKIDKIVECIEQNTPSDSRIAVFDESCGIYAKSKRLCSSKYAYIYPICLIDLTIMDSYIHDLEENNPSAIVISESAHLDATELYTFMEQNGNYVLFDTIEKSSIYIYK